MLRSRAECGVSAVVLGASVQIPKHCTNSDWFLVVDYLVFLAVAVARPGHICRTCLMEQTPSARKIQIRSSQ